MKTPRAALFIEQILSSIEMIERYLGNSGKDDFLGRTDLQDAVCMRLVVIGEAANRLRQGYDVEKKAPAVPWRNIAALRHIIAHDYQVIDMERVWGILLHRLPQLKSVLLELGGESFDPE